MSGLLGTPPAVINVGLEMFAAAIAGAGRPVAHVRWTPPGGHPDTAAALARLMTDAAVDAANRTAYDAYLASEPMLEGVRAAREAVPGMSERMLLHAGPPIAWERMCGPMQGAIVGAALLEGWAQDAAGATALAASGAIRLEPCHHHDAVAPIAGIISPSMPVWIVRDAAHDKRSFSNLNEGVGKVLRFGAHGPETLERLRWMSAVLAPALSAALERTGPLALKPLIGRAIHMGDECHNRNFAASSLLFKQLAPGLARADLPAADEAAVFEFLSGNDYFFNNVSMAACKAMLAAARDVGGSSMVSVMARNGVEFGIQMCGTGAQWFTAPAPPVKGLYFAGYGEADAAPDIGDSAITEVAGIGGFATAAAPATLQVVGGTPAEALANTRRMMRITLGRNNAFTLPALSFVGTPAGIDVRKVVDTGILPHINTGIAHRAPGMGQIGAGVTAAPLECFTKALAALERRTR